jgi:uncharacterized protein (DUF2267 family)
VGDRRLPWGARLGHHLSKEVAMSDVDDLVMRAERLGRPGTREMARRWLVVAASILRDAASGDAREVLASALPKELLGGAGSKGHSWSSALSRADGDARQALAQEAGHRARQPDPGKVAMTLVPVLALLRAEVEQHGGAAAVERLASSLPPAVAEAWRTASAAPPWGYGLIPQSYARPGHS